MSTEQAGGVERWIDRGCGVFGSVLVALAVLYSGQAPKASVAIERGGFRAAGRLVEQDRDPAAAVEDFWAARKALRAALEESEARYPEFDRKH